jgi:ELP3 family radical SAM enzyme/protein acetyltransferase
MTCTLCSKKNINIKSLILNETKNYDLLLTLIEHVNNKIVEETFDDEFNVIRIFQLLILHCTPKGYKIQTKKTLADDYRERIKNNTIKPNKIFEKLVFEIINGELCISVPSKALDSCPFNCAFCPTAKIDGNMNIAKSYTLGQPVFAKLVKNNNNLIKYLLQHMLQLYTCNPTNITKLAMRHLGGTFSTYSKLYKYEYSRDIFYTVNILQEIIKNPELLLESKKSLINLFDPDNIIISSVRKPFNYEAIELIQNSIAAYKQLSSNSLMDDKIKKLEEELLLEISKSLLLEQNYNVSAHYRIVSYSIETRPDTINITSITELLKLGVTIVELGLQSPNNDILKINKRGHTVEDSIRAIRMIKDNGLHVHGQWMMDLPGSTKDIDSECINKILSDDLRCDQIKIYPHLSMPGTETKEWFDNGIYQSWVDEDKKGFQDLLVDFISRIDETTRIVRIQRDLPKASILNPDGYTNDQPSNLEQIITKKIYSHDKTREDIRYHEPGLRFANIDNIKYYVDIKNLVYGTDIFISAQSYVCSNIKDTISNKNKDFRIIWGYCRLRIVRADEDIKLIKFFSSTPTNDNNKYGRIRELKVNGSVQSVGEKGNSVQHRGIGTNLLKIAEELAYKFDMTHVTVTSAVGVRDYYRLKHDYQLDSCGLMWKKLDSKKFININKLIPISDTKFLIDFINPTNNTIISNLIRFISNNIVILLVLVLGLLLFRAIY